jgi:hypothetical protein
MGQIFHPRVAIYLPTGPAGSATIRGIDAQQQHFIQKATAMTHTFTPHTSWTIKGSAVLDELIALIGLSAAESAALAALEASAVACAPHMADDFYARLTVHANTLEYVGGAPMAGLRGTIVEWFADLFRGRYDQSYAARRVRIGEVHVKIGLPVRYPLAMLDVVMRHGEAVVAGASDADLARRAFRKVLALDIAIFNQAYEDNQLAHLTELVGGENLARRLLAGDA